MRIAAIAAVAVIATTVAIEIVSVATIVATESTPLVGLGVALLLLCSASGAGATLWSLTGVGRS